MASSLKASCHHSGYSQKNAESMLSGEASVTGGRNIRHGDACAVWRRHVRAHSTVLTKTCIIGAFVSLSGLLEKALASGRWERRTAQQNERMQLNSCAVFNPDTIVRSIWQMKALSGNWGLPLWNEISLIGKQSALESIHSGGSWQQIHKCGKPTVFSTAVFRWASSTHQLLHNIYISYSQQLTFLSYDNLIAFRMR